MADGKADGGKNRNRQKREAGSPCRRVAVGLRLGLGLAEANDFVAILELPALAEQLDTLEALENVAFRRNGAGAFETAVLGHGFGKRSREFMCAGPECNQIPLESAGFWGCGPCGDGGLGDLGLDDLVPEELQGLGDLLDLEGFFENGDGTVLEDVVQHIAVRIAGDDDDGEVRRDLPGLGINDIAGGVREHEIEEKEIEFLFPDCGKAFLAGADDHATEAGALKEKLEHALDAGVVIDDKDSGLSLLLLPEDVAVQGILFDTPTPPDLDGRELASLDEIVHRRQGYPQVFSSFFDG